MRDTGRFTIYNMVGTDGSWFSPFGWRARAVLLAKRVPVEWVGVTPHELTSRLAFAGGRTTPLLVDRLDPNAPIYIRDSIVIARHMERLYPDPMFFPPDTVEGIALFDRMITPFWQIPGFAAFAPLYFSNGVISGADEERFRAIIHGVTGRSVEENEAAHDGLLDEFRRRLAPLDDQLADQSWLLGPMSHADSLLFSCVKCFATVARGVEHVLGPADGRLEHIHGWYRRFHEACEIDDPW